MAITLQTSCSQGTCKDENASVRIALAQPFDVLPEVCIFWVGTETGSKCLLALFREWTDGLPSEARPGEPT